MQLSNARVFVLLGFMASALAAEAASSRREAWNQPQAPFRVHGNTYYVGPHGLSVLLVASDAGHVLIDGALPESVTHVLENVRALGFDPKDIKYILNSHAHFDHAGGIAELQRATGATVISSAWGAAALEAGRGDEKDPQFTIGATFPQASAVEALEDRKWIRVGKTNFTVHYTPGHTPGGTSWTWRSCEGERCLNIVYADSLNAVSSDDFRYSGDARYPYAAQELRNSIERIAALPCDVLISAHPEGADLWMKLERREAGERDALMDKRACRRYAEGAESRLNERLERERAGQ